MKSLLQISKLKKSYGERLLFEDATAAFVEKRKVGVIGRNGAGKSTLFKIILGQEEADDGEIIRSRDLKLGYVEQHAPYRRGESVQDFLLRYTGREIWECARMAARFGIRGPMLEAAVDELAGGYQMRVKLTAMLLGDPNLLLLDEPTNYLDLGTLLMLERFLREYNGAVLIISHDREFLKRTTEHTLEVADGTVFLYPGDLEEYFAFQEERREQQLKMYKNVEARRKELQSFVDRFRAKNTKATQAKSKQKQIDKLPTIEIEHAVRGVEIRIPPVPEHQARSKSAVLRVEDLSIGYGADGEAGAKFVAKNISFNIGGGTRLAVLGDNGQGKSTLLKTLAGVLEPLAGGFRWKDGLNVAYYAQHVYNLDESVDILTTLDRMAAPGVMRQEILDMAGGFLFSGDDVRKSVAALSGGERARVALAGLLLGGCDVLLLDEPTNHLDFESVEALGHALRGWNGTTLFVSHDRTFVKLAATEILEMKDGAAEFYPGSYDEYVYSLEQRLDEDRFDEAVPEKGGPAPVDKTTGADDEAGENVYLRRKEYQAELKVLRKELRELEPRLAKLEQERDELVEFFSGGEYDADRDARLKEVQRLLEDIETKWLGAQERAEHLEQLIAVKN